MLVGGSLRYGTQHGFAESVIRIFAELADVKRQRFLRGVRCHVAGPRDFERLFGEDGSDLGCGKERRECCRCGKAAGDFGESVTSVRGGVAGGVRGVAREALVVAELGGGGEESFGTDVLTDNRHGRVCGTGERFGKFHRGTVVFFGDSQLVQVKRVVAPDHRDWRVERIAVAFHSGGYRHKFCKRGGREGGAPDPVRFVLYLAVTAFTPSNDFVRPGVHDEDDSQVRMVTAEQNVNLVGEERILLRLDVKRVADAFGIFASVACFDGHFFEVLVFDAGQCRKSVRIGCCDGIVKCVRVAGNDFFGNGDGNLFWNWLFSRFFLGGTMNNSNNNRNENGNSDATVTHSLGVGESLHGELLKDGLSVVGEFGNAFADVVQGFVALFLLEFFEFRVPAEREFLDGTDIDVSVAEPFRNGGHVLVEESSVLRDGVSAENVLAFFGKGLDELERFLFGVLERILRTAATVDEPALVVVSRVPFVHAFENVFGLTDSDDGTFGKDVQVSVGDNRCYLKNDIFFGIET